MSETSSAPKVRCTANESMHIPRLRAGYALQSAVVRSGRTAVLVGLASALLGFAIANAQGGGVDPARALAAPGKESASWAVLRKAIQSRDYAVRLLATQALGGIRTVDVTTWLEHVLADPEHDVRVAAIDALDRVHSRKALTLLRSVRDDESEALDIRAVAASALINHADE